MPIGAFKLNSIAKSVAVSAAFTVPTAAFTNDANTKLLLHFNGTNGATSTTDDADIRTAKTITAAGNAQISTAQSKFGGASALFDGTGDRLDITSSSDLALGTGDFTIEFWVRFTSRTGNQVFIDFRDTAANGAYILFGNDGGSIYLYVNGDYRIGRSGTQFAADNTWYHVALSRSGTSTKAFVDGTQVLSTYTDSTNYGGTAPDIGELNSSFGLTGFGVKGYLDEFRISNTARYTSNFTPSTTAFTNDSNTLLLLHMNGTNASTTFTDDATNRTAKTMTMVSSATLSTTQKKFGTASLYVDGTGADYVSTPDSGDWDLQAAPRTFECWCYINSFTNISRNSPNHLTKLMGHMDQSGNSYWTFGPNTDQGMTFYYWSGSNNWFHSTTKDLVTGQWYHMALIVTSSGAKVYVDGVEYISTPLTNTPTVGNTIFSIGADFGQCMNAYIDEVRVSHVNRYT